MKQLSSNELRALFLKFFQKKGHSVIPSASVIPENDPTVLFTTAGMHPLVPYLLGQKHPQGTRLTDVQKCIRTGDIDEVGDMSHLTFFEMLGNWSLGDYFKDQMIPWSWEFLTSPEWLGIDPDKLAFTVFEGDEDCPRDEEAANLWRKCGVKDDHLFYLPKEHNWWGPAGVTGPCGPDTEMFIITKKPCGPDCSPACHCGAYLEIWNDVFMQYNKQKDGSFVPLTQKNVDTGMGLERTICVLNGKKSVYETDAFTGILAKIEELCGKKYTSDDENTRAFRIVADHMRTSTFIIGDPRGIGPSNVGQGYILRRLIRRAVRYGMGLGLQEGFTAEIAKVIIDQYKAVYPELEQNKAFVLEQLTLEEGRFARTLKQGEKEFDKVMNNLRRTREAMEKILADDTLAAAEEAVKTHVLRPQPDMVSAIEAVKAGDLAKVKAECQKIHDSLNVIDGRSAFKLYDTYGFPIEITKELAAENGLTVDEADFAKRFEQHQATSRSGAEQIFKGGLADHSEQTTCLHTATHLLQAALRKVLGDEVHQKGSNITAERLRFDFTFGRKVTPEELAQVEALVNEAIAAKVPITMEEMTVSEAKAQGAMGLFESKYGEVVRVYTMGPYSKEICGGPHANNTGDLVSFKIIKEEASSAGVRRIKATIGRKAE
ncbi:MAG: alanine--tRNA ligase [Clostridiales bacterium]|nr:alanine--tRNA ligase [Clostridiales bacterium]MDY5469160.1 alanine--tRNA ligase [Eubacteriales bacterium]